MYTNESGNSTSNDSCSKPNLKESKSKFETLKDKFFYPAGVTKHKKLVVWLGRIGFVSKGLVYLILGILVCISSQQLPTPEGTVDNESPQTVFILLAGVQDIGIPILVILACGLLFYSLWRFVEAGFGQGSDIEYSKMKNFFKYRLSPFVSGCVYISYLSYIIKIIIQLKLENKNNSEVSTSDNCFPNCYNTTDLGRAFIIIIGIAFLIATITQLIPAFTGSFYLDLNTDQHNKFIRYFVHALGHLGFLGRAGVFLLVATLMFKASSDDVDDSKYTVSEALNQLRDTRVARAFLFILGLFLCCFGIFAIINIKFKHFPSRPHSGTHPRTKSTSTDEVDQDPFESRV